MSEHQTPIVISSYAASPAHSEWDPGLEAELLQGLCALPDVVGLEVPWVGDIHPHDPEWFRAHVPAGALLTLTPLPWVMRRCAEVDGYGIASLDRDGRRLALNDVMAVAKATRKLCAESTAPITSVMLHSAPRGTGDSKALAASLEEIASWDWAGAQLLLEHCDAPVSGRPFEKGFLSLDSEIAAIHSSHSAVRLWLNWGRSVIETRDPDGVTRQIQAAHDSGLLHGLAFSGTAAADGPYGDAWEDRHLPLASADPTAGSLLDDAHLSDALRAAGNVRALGLKVSRRPRDRSAQDVLRTVGDNLTVLRTIAAEVA